MLMQRRVVASSSVSYSDAMLDYFSKLPTEYRTSSLYFEILNGTNDLREVLESGSPVSPPPPDLLSFLEPIKAFAEVRPVAIPEQARELLEDYYTETTPLAFTIIELTRNSYTGRLNACFDQLFSIAATSPILPLRRAYMSYRSHVEAYIICEPAVEAPRLRRQRLERFLLSV